MCERERETTPLPNLAMLGSAARANDHIWPDKVPYMGGIDHEQGGIGHICPDE